MHANYSKPVTADFIVLNPDYLSVPEDGICFLGPVMTGVGGRVAYEKK